jgi:hypothetical protein
MQFVLLLSAMMFGLSLARLEAQLQPRPTREPIISRLDSRFDELVPRGAVLEKIVDDHGWAEGPVWVKDGGRARIARLFAPEHPP